MVAALPLAERRYYKVTPGRTRLPSLTSSYEGLYGSSFNENPDIDWNALESKLDIEQLHARDPAYYCCLPGTVVLGPDGEQMATEYIHELQLAKRSGTTDVVEELLLERRKEANARTKNIYG